MVSVGVDWLDLWLGSGGWMVGWLVGWGAKSPHQASCQSKWIEGCELAGVWGSSGISQLAQRSGICLPAQEPQETRIWCTGREDLLEEETATHSSVLAWKILWTEEPDGLQSMGSHRVGHDQAYTHKEAWRKEQQDPFQLVWPLKKQDHFPVSALHG